MTRCFIHCNYEVGKKRMGFTSERVWAMNNPEGRIHVEFGPVFVFWNFAIGDSSPKPEHKEYAASNRTFLGFVARQLKEERTIVLQGTSSTSGPGSINMPLSENRADAMATWILYVLKAVQNRYPEELRQLSDAALLRRLRSSGHGSKTGYLYTLSGAMPDFRGNQPVNYRPRGNMRGSQDPYVVHRRVLDEGGEAAFNRAVWVFADSSNMLDSDDIESFGRTYLRDKVREGAIRPLPPDYAFWELWVPGEHALKQMFPGSLFAEYDPLIGSRTPPAVPNAVGHRVMAAAGYNAPGDYSVIRDFIGRHLYSESDVRYIMDLFLQQASSSKRILRRLEDGLMKFYDQNGSDGLTSIGGLDDYITFRDQVFRNTYGTCMLAYNFDPAFERGSFMGNRR